MELVKLACELPDTERRRSLALWTCAELARAMVRCGAVDSISTQSVQRILASSKLRPWRVHHWLSTKVPLDDAFRQQVLALQELYTRRLADDEIVLSLDEKTSLQPRTRSNPTLPAMPGKPVKLEHEYKRKGALQLFAALDTRSGKVTAIMRPRKRQKEFIELLETIDATTPDSVRIIHLVCDNVSTHHGKQTRAWLERHSRFKVHFTPVHCSWMNQVEQWWRVGRRNCTPSPSQNRTGASRLIRLPSSKRALHPSLPVDEETRLLLRKSLDEATCPRLVPL
jgi:transposase